jgi:hypothetical protein
MLECIWNICDKLRSVSNSRDVDLGIITQGEGRVKRKELKEKKENREFVLKRECIQNRQYKHLSYSCS